MLKCMNKEKNVFVNRTGKNSGYYTRYEGNLLTGREVTEALLKLIVNKDDLKRVRSLQSQGNYHGITACAVVNLPSLEMEAKKAGKIKNPRASEFFQLIEKLKRAEATAKERMEVERQKKAMIRKKIMKQIQDDLEKIQDEKPIIIPLTTNISTEKVPPAVEGTIVGQIAPAGSPLPDRKKFKDYTYVLNN